MFVACSNVAQLIETNGKKQEWVMRPLKYTSPLAGLVYWELYSILDPGRFRGSADAVIS